MISDKLIKCKYCPKRMYHGDYNLQYCDISRDIVTPDKICPLPEIIKKAHEEALKNMSDKE